MSLIRVKEAQHLLEQHLQIQNPTVFKLMGKEWDLLPGVYAPNLTRCAALYAEWLPFPTNGEFCEIGCGTGYISIFAALRGCDSVMAIDINSTAIQNTQLNAIRHSVQDRVQTLCTDMFNSLNENIRYDMIFWNSSYLDFSLEDKKNDLLNMAFSDPSYDNHKKYFTQAFQHLYDGGQVFLGFSSMGNVAKLEKIATDCNLVLKLERTYHSESQFGSMEYQLIQLVLR